MNKNQLLKGALALGLLLPFASAPVPVQAASAPVAIHLNGAVLNTDQAAFNENGTVYVPVRHVIEALGGEVKWDNASQKATATINGTTITFEIGTATVRVGEEILDMNGQARLVHDRTMVPVRFVGEAVGGEVQWDGAKKVVIVDTRSRPLFDAIRAGNVPKVAGLLKSGMNPNVTQKQKSPLFVAVEAGELEIARLLLAQPGIDPYGSPDSHTPLHEAVTRSDIAAISLLLEGVKHPSFEQKVVQESALYTAVVRGRHEAAKTLLQHGVNPNIPNIIEQFRNTPDYAPQNDLLIHAAIQNNADLVAALLAAGAGPNVHLDGDLASALHFAAINNYDRVIRELLTAGADPNIAPHSGWTPLMVAAERGHTAAVKALVELGAPLDVKNELGANAYLIAKTHGNEATMQLLADAGADTAYSPKLSDDAVHFRKHTTHFTDADTELMRNAYIGQTGNVKALLAQGADPNVVNIQGTAINYASGYTETVQAILSAPSFHEAQSKNSALNVAIDTKNTELANSLLQAGAKTDYKTYNLALNTAPDLLDALFKSGMDPDEPLYDTKNYGLTLAAMWGQSDIVLVFLANKANPNLANEEGKTPLSYAILRGDTINAGHLLKYGADVNHADDNGHTPLYYAVGRSDVAAVNLLLSSKATVTQAIRDLAKEKTNQDIIEALK
ncbi:ankyrin repeat protein [Tumebacillus sp. BK434]|uniref:ankyrin repeat domain-containing protein n=1 Tax=Tumebacillus sp. BK434 TaxID=2512169 RepID=UPI00104D1147|nr:ankyrin repeat domain-containing protein [Tumebacillus sp. BK434]TCP55846.1 ankyrin repeat protein [Tumebacillus sp. BK434]